MKTASVFLYIITVSCLINAQQEKQDSIRMQYLPDKNIQYYLSEDFELYFPRSDFDKYEIDPASFRLSSGYMISQIIKNDMMKAENQFDFLSNYHEFYIQNSKVSPLTYVLGMAQAGAVGYLAYKHIKKYGFR